MPNDLAAAAEPPKTMTDYAYGRLREDIIAGSLAPGARLRVDQLRERYDIGATPLREALSRLSADGFVLAHGQRGFRVVPMSAEHLEDLTRVRVLIECETLRDSILHGDERWEAGVVAAYYQVSKLEGRADARYEDWERLNDAFHSALLAGCRSELLPGIHRSLYDQHMRYRNLSRQVRQDVPRDVRGEHEAIYQATLERDVAAACEATERHIRRTMEITLELVRKGKLLLKPA
ncbi:GntR family transcriptional regulator [Alkalilimnicola sp. S0819]|nr:GntR family transcriptional regulator [Alkalilimnicola sp. S0819]MPQ16611.1 FCD domain-containing protein [Alkalilimnicola sp. S0819]